MHVGPRPRGPRKAATLRVLERQAEAARREEGARRALEERSAQRALLERERWVAEAEKRAADERRDESIAASAAEVRACVRAVRAVRALDCPQCGTQCGTRCGEARAGWGAGGRGLGGAHPTVAA